MFDNMFSMYFVLYFQEFYNKLNISNFCFLKSY